jgi:methionine-rich copper-binding protein CopC
MGGLRDQAVPSARTLVRRRFLQFCCICALVAYSISAYAHAVLVKAVPVAHSTVAGTVITVRLQFNVRIDPKRSRVALVLPDKSQKLLSVNQPAPELLESQVTGLANGDYSIRWQVLASDGHITQGEIPFKVAS